MTARAGARFAPVLGAVVLAACSTSSGSPLGGPYGGDTIRLGPTDGGFPTVDATYSVPIPPRQPGTIPGTVGSWMHIYYAYLDKGTIGNCAARSPCHQAGMPNPPKAYKWLQDQGYLGGSSPALTRKGDSCISWYGGDMPIGGVKLPVSETMAAVTEMNQWATMGAANNQ